VIGHSTPTPDPFITPTSASHPSLYDRHVPYGAPSPSAASDRYNSPAPLPGQAKPQNDYLNPSAPRVHYQDHDPHDADSGDVPLLRRDGPSAITLVDGSSMRESYAMPGGFDPTLIGPDGDDQSNIRYGRIPQRVPRRYKTKKRYECVPPRLGPVRGSC
jgi:chitin synthase